MGGSESLFDGVSGLSDHQTWMDVIGNNIANVNTSGFKADQFNFEDQLSQELQGASAAVQGGPGGTDFEQVGLGTHIGSILSNQQQGSLQTTNLPTDFAIQGDGFFIVNDGQANFYTRDSNFIVDGFGNINSAATGFHLQGYGIKQVGNTVTLDNTRVVNLTVPQQINPAAQTNLLDLIGNLQSSATTPQTQSVGVYDSLGQLHNVVLTFTPSGKADGNWTITATSADLTPGSSIQVGGGNASSTQAGAAALHFNSLGQLDGTVTPLTLTFIAGESSTITNPPAGGPPVAVNAPEGPTQAAHPWLIPGTNVPSNAAQSAVILNINDPQVGNLTQFASPTVTSTQAAPNAAVIPNPQNSTVDITGNLSTISATTNSTMGIMTFVAQDSVGATHTFQLGMASAGGSTNSIVSFTPQLLTVDGFSGVAGGNLQQGSGAQTTATFAATDSTGQPHTYTVVFTPNQGPAGITDGTVWGMQVTQVDGADPMVLGNLDGSAAAGTTTTFSFNRVEPDGATHQYTVTLTSNGGPNATYNVTGVTVDGGAAPAGTTLTATGGPVGNNSGNLTVTLTSTGANSLDIPAGDTEAVTFDFSQVTSNPGSSSLNQEVLNPGAALRYDPSGSGQLLSGGTMTIGVNANSLFLQGPPVFREDNAAENFNFDLAQLTNDVATASVIGQPANPTTTAGTIDATTLPASLQNPPTITFSGGVARGITTVDLNIEGPPPATVNSAFGDNNAQQTLTIDFSRVTNNSNPTGLIGPLAGSAGNSAGTLKDFNVDQNGVLHGVYTNGFTQVIGQILLASFENPGGLERVGKNLLQVSSDSGVVNIGTAGAGKFGTIAEGNIETSNVDLAQEFSNMILAERGFQANSRIITTSDTMLEQLVNLKQTA
jgi:flagellar hook protein FlgE